MNRNELGRRAVHTLGLVIPLSYLILQNRGFTVVFLLISLLVASILEYLRLKRGYENIVFEKLTRSYEGNKLAGYYLYILGLVFVWIFYEWQIAVVSSVMLGIVDPIGGVLNDDSRKKPPRVVVSVIVSSFVISMAVLTLLNVELPLSLIISASCAISTTVADCRKFKISGEIVDDNLIIPILSGFFMTIVKYCYVLLLVYA